MARARSQSNGRLDKLDEAISSLVQTQAIMVQNQAAFQSQMAELERETAKRFARIEAILLDHSRILAEHTRTLQALPDAVREKIGFKTS